MFQETKERASRYVTRTSLGFNAVVVLLAGTAYLAAHTGHLKADVEFVGFQIGGGTEQHAAREQQLAALSQTLPATALTPAPQKIAAAPLPGRKPQQ